PRGVVAAPAALALGLHGAQLRALQQHVPAGPLQVGPGRAVYLDGVLADLLAVDEHPARPGAEVAVLDDGLRLGSGAGPDVAAQRDDPVLEQQPRLACGEAGAARRDQVLPGQSDLPEGGGAGPFGLLGDGLAPLPFDPGGSGVVSTVMPGSPCRSHVDQNSSSKWSSSCGR